jgi:MYXO-CTERM domain-containing protein
MPESNFAGLLSLVSFDQAIIYRPPEVSDLVVIDNLYFGVPAPVALPLLALAGVVGRRRRRTA